MFSIYSLISVIGVIQGLFILSLLASNKNKTLTTKWAIVLFVVFIVDLSWYFLYLQGYLKNLWFLYGIEYLVLYLYGPTLYLYVRSHFEKSSKHFKRPLLFLHFVPAAIIFVLMSSQFFREQTIGFLNNLNLNQYLLFSKYNAHSIVFNFGLWYLHITIYLIYTVKFLNSYSVRNSSHDTISKLKHIKWIKILLLGYLSFPLITLILFLINPFISDLPISTYDMANILLVFHIFVISYIGYSNQEVVINPIKFLKRQNTNLSNIDTEEIEIQLQDLMETEKLYLDETLTLSKLAKELNVTTHQLSEYVNGIKNTSFNDFVNAFRIEHAQSLLLDDAGNIYTLEGIASKSGFKSLTTFHRNFKKHTGLTPNQWLKNNK
ncbi:MAG: helix-turn-helix domain-containing protein [Flavobacteriaceae bacterium]|nr:helix-turn-helix domain-containing protein [Flavobacteriaceae bacterium]